MALQPRPPVGHRHAEHALRPGQPGLDRGARLASRRDRGLVVRGLRPSRRRRGKLGRVRTRASGSSGSALREPLPHQDRRLASPVLGGLPGRRQALFQRPRHHRRDRAGRSVERRQRADRCQGASRAAAARTPERDGAPIKNTLAMVKAIVSQTMRHADTKEEASVTIDQRIAAFVERAGPSAPDDLRQRDHPRGRARRAEGPPGERRTA